MLILGLDPGLARLGWGLLQYDGVRMGAVDYGVLTTEAHTDLPTRLVQLYEGVTDLIKRYEPDQIALEELFFAKNVTTAISVGEARGITLLACRQATNQLYEYTPMQIKQALVGYGKAEKQQIQQMVKLLLRLDEIPKPDDAADGLAIAICHANTARMHHQFRIQ